MLFPFLEYEMRAAERYGRFVSLVMVSAGDDLENVKQVLQDCVRSSDVLADYDHSLVVMMGETDKNDALSAVHRYGNFFMNQIDLRFSVATYPEDAIRPDSLVQTAYKRLVKARQGTSGTIVSDGD